MRADFRLRYSQGYGSVALCGSLLLDASANKCCQRARYVSTLYSGAPFVITIGLCVLGLPAV
jgi:hypothetical protein